MALREGPDLGASGFSWLFSLARSKQPTGNQMTRVGIGRLRAPYVYIWAYISLRMSRNCGNRAFCGLPG